MILDEKTIIYFVPYSEFPNYKIKLCITKKNL